MYKVTLTSCFRQLAIIRNNRQLGCFRRYRTTFLHSQQAVAAVAVGLVTQPESAAKGGPTVTVAAAGTASATPGPDDPAVGRTDHDRYPDPRRRRTVTVTVPPVTGSAVGVELEVKLNRRRVTRTTARVANSEPGPSGGSDSLNISELSLLSRVPHGTATVTVKVTVTVTRD